MPTSLTCRECGNTVGPEVEACPSCGVKAPFACRVCGKAIGCYSLFLVPSPKHPYGAFSEEEEPLCHEHRVTRCFKCGNLFQKKDMEQRDIGEIDAAFCAECSTQPMQVPEPAMPPNVGCALAIFVVLVIGLAAYTWVALFSPGGLLGVK